MKTPRFMVSLPARAVAYLVFATVAAGLTQAQSFTNFNSGSTGTVDLIITTNTTIALPQEGILHYRNISIGSGATLTFSNNALNTPVYLLARSNVIINGTIDVSGKAASNYVPGRGGPGGFDGGFGAYASGSQASIGDGKGPGGGKGYSSQFNRCDFTAGNSGFFSYGNVLCAPLVGGSGGAGGPIWGADPGPGGGGGGGAILIAANSWITNNGAVTSVGGGGARPVCVTGGAGSAGAIRLVAPLVSGAGSLNVGGPGGYGRMRIDSTNRDASLTLRLTPPTAVSATRGSQGFVFPQSNLLTIASVTVGTNSHALNPSTPASISLPAGPAITNAIVEVRAEGPFYGAGSVPIAVVVTPENGASGTYNAAINLQVGLGSTNVTVTIPAGTISTLHVWTR